MSTSAKRFGLEVVGNLELESRLRRIEVELDKKADSNTDAVSTARLRNFPPQVIGISVKGQTPGAVTVGWNASTVPDLRRYEVQFSTTINFSADVTQTFNVRDIAHTFNTASVTGGSGGTVFFARVRAVNRAGISGPYSVILNTATGEVVSGDIADGAVDTEQISDSAVTQDKTDLIGLPPAPSAGDSLKFIRSNVAESGVEYGFKFPFSVTADAYIRGNPGGSEVVFQTGTLPPVAVGGDANKVVTVLGADTLVYTDQSPSDAAATAGGEDGQNRTGTLTLPGGFNLHWDTVNVAHATQVDVDIAGIGTIKSVIATAAELTATSSLSSQVNAWVLDSDTITLFQENGDSEAVDVTYWIISEG